MMLKKSFGYKELNIIYQDLVGACGIGIDNGETHVNCIKRECLEEAGQGLYQRILFERSNK